VVTAEELAFQLNWCVENSNTEMIEIRHDILAEVAAMLARLTAAEAEIANLERWKAEAMAVLTEWDACYDILEAVGRGAPIGRSKARHVAEYLKRQTGVE
jgi:uncharacterized protein YydD (DUF2326 family)